MPFDHTLEEGSRIVVVTGSGTGSLDEVRDSVLRVFTNPRVGRDYSILVLLDDVESDRTLGELEQLATLIGRVRTHFTGRIATVSARVGQITSNQVVALTVDPGQNRMRAFQSEAEARRWLLDGS